MKNLSLLAAFTLLFATLADAQDFAWAHGFGGTSADVALSTAGDENGNLYVTGYFSGTVDFDLGPGVVNLTSAGISDIYVLKLSAEGELIWARQMGGTGADQGNEIVVDARGYILLIGSFQDTVDFDPGNETFNLSSEGNTDVFVIKLDPRGNLDWAEQIGSPNNEYASGLATDDRGNIYMCGSYRGTVDFDPGAGTLEMTSAGESDIFTLKLDWKGGVVWARSMGGTAVETADNLTVSADGFVYTMGVFRGTADFDPGAGTATLNTIGFFANLFVQKMDADGNYVWAKQVGGSYFQFGNSIKTTPSGDLLLSGTFSETADFDPGPGTMNLTAEGFDIFILSLTAAGGLKWVYHVEGDGTVAEDVGESLAIGRDGSIYVCGTFSVKADFNPGPPVQNLISAGSEDCFLLKLDSTGAFIWARRMGGTSEDRARSLYLDPHENMYTVGSFWATADLNPLAGVNNLVSQGGPDIFVQKLTQDWNFTGRVFQDLDADGLQDSGELWMPNVLVSAAATQIGATTDEAGRYHLYSNILNDTVRVIKSRPYWDIAPAFAIPDSMQTPMDFSISAPYAPDLCLLAVSTTPFRPGFVTDIQIQVVNTGSVLIDSAIVELLIVTDTPPGPLEFVSGSPLPQVISNDHYTWRTMPLLPGERQIIHLTVRTLVGTPLGTPLTLSSYVGPEDDVNQDNNRSRFSTSVVASLDPNDKQVSPQALLPAALDTSTLQYHIRFQNTGNFPAEFVFIRDTLPQELDLSTLQVLGASHPFTWRVYDGRVLEFRFDPIVLPDSISDEPNSHGFAAFQIKPRANLLAGDSISNLAGIYFDYNAPVITPAAVFKVIDISSGTVHTEAGVLEFGLSPNPVSRNAAVNLELPASLDPTDPFITIFDQLGRAMRQMRSPAGQRRIYLQELPAGVYVVHVRIGEMQGWKTLVVK